MSELIALRINCPLCNKSLLNPKCLVDNIPGVKLEITTTDGKGIIHLSSLYGSYNYTANIKIPQGSTVDFSCPHCKQQIKTKDKCEECSAPMIPLKIEGNGIVNICSRAGCKKHSVEFDDIKHALHHFYQNFKYSKPLEPSLIDETTAEIKDDIEVIPSGSYLRSYCPHCEESLIDNHEVKLKVISKSGEGILVLSPYLNVFTTKSTIDIQEGEVLQDVKCSHCDTSLFIKDDKCELCSSKIIGMHVAAVSKIIDFFICSKKGCLWHGMDDSDITDIILEDSREW
ncbi:MAG: class I tRNA ligase family protein [Candidatus Heimdallarchaeota archaeon]